MSRTLEARQRQTARAREALAQRFSTPEEKSAYFRSLGQKSAAGRLVLSPDETRALSGVETMALGEAYALLSKIAERARGKASPTPLEAA